MRQLIGKGVFVVPLLMGVGVLCLTGTQDVNRLPGRAVDAAEASEIKGGACGGYTSDTCSSCGTTGKTAVSTSGGQMNSKGTAGCDGNCNVPEATSGCAG